MFDTNAHTSIARIGSGEFSLPFAPGLFDNLSIILIESILQPERDFEIRQVRRCRFVIFHSAKNEQVLRLSVENASSESAPWFGAVNFVNNEKT